jgi:hypothetical protein
MNTFSDATALEHLLDNTHLACVNLIANLFEVGLERLNGDRPHGQQQFLDRVFSWKRQQQSTAE